jgi:hypothetical protein
VPFTSFEGIEARFQQEWQRIVEEMTHAKD